jgi:mannose-1-phosphate guanylyltransferase / phosphomannomutase
MIAVVMAGGEGSRLRPLTLGRPKPMVPMLNVPVMEHIVTLLKRHNITEIVVTVHYMASVIEDYFGDGSDFGVHMRYVLEETPLGTAGSVKNAQAMLDEPFLIISGDALTDIDLTRVIRYHQDRRAQATLVLVHVNNPLEYGVVITNPEGAV